MIGESDDRHHNPAVHVPPWVAHRNDSTAAASSPLSVDVSPSSNDDHVNYDAIKAALQRYFPSKAEPEATVERGDEADLLAVDEYSSDEFRMYDFKVRRCTRVRAHDWTECPYAHPGEKARRRDPRRFNYSGAACSNFRKGSCHKGEACEFAHGVFECWLHPSRYRTQACKDGFNCKRRVCFFAHSPEELRVVHGEHGPTSITSLDTFDESHAVTPIFESPPVTPVADSLGSINKIVASLSSLQLTKGNSMPSSWRRGSPVFWSPNMSLARPGFYSLPATPIRPAVGHMGGWDKELEVEPVMERVESGRELRARMFEKLSKENSLDRPDPVDSSGPTPILGGSPIP